VRGAVDRGFDPATGEEGDLTGRAFRARAEDVAALRAIPREALNDVTVIAYHSWETSRSRVAGLSPAGNVVVLTAPILWGFAYWGPNCRYHLENFRAARDAPGEWFLAHDGTLSYLPRPGEDRITAEVVAPVCAEFVQVQGEPEAGKFVEHVTFRGLRFRHGQYVLPPGGHADPQAEVTIPAVVMLDGARNVSFEDGEIAHIGTAGMWFRRGCRDCRVTRTWFEDLGAGGVKIGEGGALESIPEAARTSAIVRDNNIIHHLGWGVLSDLGGFYTLGFAEGTTVSHNVAHDIYSYDRYGRGGWGLYNDEGTTRIRMENNLVYRFRTGTYHQHYGKEDLIHNNIFAFSLDGQIQRSRVEPHLSFTYTGNIVYWDTGPLATKGSLNDDQVALERNRYFNATGATVDFQGLTIEERQAKGWDKGSIIADPLFADAKNGDFRLQPGSPAAKTGFTPFDDTKAGLYGDAAWTSIPKKFAFAEVQFAPAPPPLEVDEDRVPSRQGSGADPQGAADGIVEAGTAVPGWSAGQPRAGSGRDFGSGAPWSERPCRALSSSGPDVSREPSAVFGGRPDLGVGSGLCCRACWRGPSWRRRPLNCACTSASPGRALVRDSRAPSPPASARAEP
jgi:hypothetical protein